MTWLKFAAAFLLIQGIIAVSLPSASDKAKFGASTFVPSNVEARVGDVPHHVSIYYQNNEFVSSGVLIKKDWVLTSAFNVYNGTNYLVQAGHVNINAVTPYANVQQSLTNQTIIHEEFKRDKYYAEHGIALLRLVTPIQITDSVNVVQLPGKDDKLNFSSLYYASGWGWGKNSNNLQIYKFFVQNYEFCKNALAKTRGIDFILHASQTCISNPNIDVEASMYDFGDPLIDYDKLKDPVLRGIVTSPPKGNEKHSGYTIITKISPYVDWIDKQTNSAFSNATYGVLVIVMAAISIFY